VGGEPLRLGEVTLQSRLILGSGKYATPELMLACLDAAGSEMVTVAVRRLDLSASGQPTLLDLLAPRYHILPNTAGCYNAVDAIRTAELARELAGTRLIKLEVLGCQRTLLPDPLGTIEATRELVAQGFIVLVYTSDDPILAERLEQAGATAVMPAGSPIGSGQGILNPANIRLIRERVSVPVVVDAGVGTASDVTVAMELGVDGVLLNTGVALAGDPLRMARAMRHAWLAGWLAAGAGRIPRKAYASASSPLAGVITTRHGS
jgi:thiazole synthase